MNRLLRSVIWSLSQRSSAKGRLDRSLKLIEYVENRTELNDLELAHKATILARTKRYNDAETYLHKILDKKYSVDNNDHEYIRLYSQSILHALRGELDKEEKAKDKAANIRCKHYLRIWLPL
jgi:hypothetical protein